METLLRAIQARYTASILAKPCAAWPCARFAGRSLKARHLCMRTVGWRCCILKIAPGVWNTTEQITGRPASSSCRVDFVRYLAKTACRSPAAASKNGEWVEVIPLDEQACFLAILLRKSAGSMYPTRTKSTSRADPGGVGTPERSPASAFRSATSPPVYLEAPALHANDCWIPGLIPPREPHLPAPRRMPTPERLPQESSCYGLVHGDFHHGNSAWTARKSPCRLRRADYFWYPGSVRGALQLPAAAAFRSRQRRLYALHYLTTS